MFGPFFQRHELHAAARRYAQELPRQLQRDYGASDIYTPAQIARSAGRANLPMGYLRLGYAQFLNEAAFQSLPEASAESWAELRALWQRYAPRRPVSDGFQPAPENPTIPP